MWFEEWIELSEHQPQSPDLATTEIQQIQNIITMLAAVYVYFAGLPESINAGQIYRKWIWIDYFFKPFM